MEAYVREHVLRLPKGQFATNAGTFTLLFRSKFPAEVVRQARHVVLVLDTHNYKKYGAAKGFLKHVLELPTIQTVGVIAKASEMCDNAWLEPFIRKASGSKLRFVFMTYGPSTALQRDFEAGLTVPVFHGPLGVATCEA